MTRTLSPGAGRILLACAILACLLMLPMDAWASSGGTMPWSSGMNQLGTDVRGPLAFVFILMVVVGGVIEYVWGGQLSGLLTGVGRAGLGIGLIGGLVTFASIFGLTAAVVA